MRSGSIALRQLEFSFQAGVAAARVAEDARHEAAALPKGFDAELTLFCAQEAERLRLLPLAAAVEVWWNGRLRTTAGLADYDRLRIDLNPLLMRFAPREPLHTLRHELAHLIAHQRAGRLRRIEAHGPEWQKACRDLGIPGEKASHQLKLAPRRRVRRNWKYTCPECGYVLHRVRRMSYIAACADCCRQHNKGRFSIRYRFIEHRLKG